MHELGACLPQIRGPPSAASSPPPRTMTMQSSGPGVWTARIAHHSVLAIKLGECDVGSGTSAEVKARVASKTLLKCVDRRYKIVSRRRRMKMLR